MRTGVDIGGTFTDCVVVDLEGARSVSKSPTTHGSLSDGVLAAVAVNAEQRGLMVRELLARTELFVHGTTVATNAMLTRSRTTGRLGRTSCAHSWPAPPLEAP